MNFEKYQPAKFKSKDLNVFDYKIGKDGSPTVELDWDKSSKLQIDYFTKYFYKLDTGNILFRKGPNNYQILDYQSFNRTFLKITNDKFKKYWDLSNTNIYELVIDPKAEFIEGTNINSFPGFMHPTPTGEPTEKSKGLKMMLKFIKDVMSSSNEQFNFLIKWFANIAHGNKNTSILYVKSSTQGIGKSTLTDFLCTHVFGTKITLPTCNSQPIKTSNNSILCGKILVCFEELANSSVGEWSEINSKLNTMATESTLMFCDKYIKQYEAKNINSYIINTNDNAIKNLEGRRYFVVDVSTKYKGNHAFFNKLRKTCFNDDVGKEFYHYLLSIDVSDFNSQMFPVTENKKLASDDNLNPAFKFIKFNYILKNIDIDMRTKDLYNQYISYCRMINYKYTLTKNKFIRLLKEVGLNWKKVNNTPTYQFTVDQLTTVAEKFNWMSDFDEEEQEDNDIMIDMSEWVSRSEYNRILKKLERYEKIKRA